MSQGIDEVWKWKKGHPSRLEDWFERICWLGGAGRQRKSQLRRGSWEAAGRLQWPWGRGWWELWWPALDPGTAWSPRGNGGWGLHLLGRVLGMQGQHRMTQADGSSCCCFLLLSQLLLLHYAGLSWPGQLYPPIPYGQTDNMRLSSSLLT